MPKYSTKKEDKRFFQYGFKTGLLEAGSKNSIADVTGVKVGHVTKIEGRKIRTGLTLVDPGIRDLYHQKLPAAIYIGNGYGKLAGYTQVEELGTIETPMALTNTLAVGTVLRGLVELVLGTTPGITATETINAVVGETNDGFLNDIQADSISREDVIKAYESLSSDFDTGCVGAGTGTRAFSWKGGIGTASRIVKIENKKYAVGVLVQTNYGGALAINGVPIGRLLGKTDFDPFLKPGGDGSCMIIMATDAPLTARQLKRMAKRAVLGLGRTGAVMANGSGDYSIAFSTSRDGLEGSGSPGRCLNDKDLTPLFLAAVESVEESVYDALFAAETTTGRDGNTLEALPKEKTLSYLKKYSAQK